MRIGEGALGFFTISKIQHNMIMKDSEAGMAGIKSKLYHLPPM